MIAPDDLTLDDDEVLGTLARGDLALVGLLPRSSNSTFLARVTDATDELLGVYKPRDGETPLWDFPDGTLYRREVAAYVVARALGWPRVPPTLVREGPHGVGSVQRFLPFDPQEHYFTLLDDPERQRTFRRVAAFDVVINNADRKSGHCLLAEDGELFFIDHGVCFSEDPKLRTVIWDFVGEPIAAPRPRTTCAAWPRGSRPDRSASASTPCSRPRRSRRRAGGSTGCSARAASPSPVPSGPTRGRRYEPPRRRGAVSRPAGPTRSLGQMELPPFQRLLEEHRVDVYRFLLASVGPQDADDCFQETFLSALRAYPSLRDASNLRGWLLTIATRKALDHWRSAKRRPVPVDELPEVAAPVPEAADPELWRAVAELPPLQRAAVIHRYVLDLPYAEIGAAIGTSEEAARANAYEGRRKLRTRKEAFV